MSRFLTVGAAQMGPIQRSHTRRDVVERLIAHLREARRMGCDLVVFPELTLSGYSIEDILLQDTLLESVEEALVEVAAASAVLAPVLVVGAPLRHHHRIYNTAVVIHVMSRAARGTPSGTSMRVSTAG